MSAAVFHVGDTVTWRSQAGGSTKTKTGVVIRVLDPGESLRPSVIFGLAKTHNAVSIKTAAGLPRSHTSYLVSVAAPGRKAKPKLYWPVVSRLRLGQPR